MRVEVRAGDLGDESRCPEPVASDLRRGAATRPTRRSASCFLQDRKPLQKVYRTASGREVDFVWLDRHGDQHLVQVCADLAEDATRERELGALAEAMDEVPHESAFVVSIHEDCFATVDGKEVRMVPAWRWLAMP